MTECENCEPEQLEIKGTTGMKNHIQRVLAGEYDAPGVNFEKPPIILDIGANVGSFTLWALRRWPDCTVRAYEPHPKNAKLFRENVGDQASLEEVIVTPGRRRTELLYNGVHNLGECSLHDGPEQNKTEFNWVGTFSPIDLPASDILKVDTEGHELYIIREYLMKYPEEPPSLIMFEFHTIADRLILDVFMHTCGYRLFRANMLFPYRGTCVYLRSDITPLGKP